MSVGPVSGTVRSGLLAQLVADSTATQTQMNRLTRQSASGKVADTYGGLGNAASVSINLRPEMARVQAWQQSVSTASTTLETTQNVLGQLESIATSFGSQALGTAMQSPTGATALAAEAKVTLQQVLGLLNTRVDGQYAFAGTDSANAPIDSTALAAFTATIGTQVAGLNTGTAPATVVAAVVTQAGTAGFAAAAGAAAPQVQAQTGDGQNVPTAFVAGANSFPGQAGSGTGSYVRDLIAGLAGLAGLDTTTASEATLTTYGAGISQLLQGAAGAIANDEAGFGQVQSELTTQGTALSDTLTTLTTQVSGAEDVNMAATATALSQVQTQLQASYQLIAGIKQLSLTAYL